ncbi:ABC transporter substrate-binding protein [Comamonas piscis]|uniref:ABC transporter substrate-binding protein n=1 Tax=Comamonas piscis TaxID=1562974 RepID=A0A7G5EIL4_9BURK|nr:ABC transporter substrate-binding protein [Comamonas piscis]QMV73839.1 ABC transporter substrate-binding protein [Comamonas piscis]WSO32263.1 ABC transporter substrate-binding protein [Comamonas piscis]
MTRRAIRHFQHALAAAAAVALLGCDPPAGQGAASSTAPAAVAAAPAADPGLLATPLVIDVCGQPQRYDRVPQRAITHDVNITEMFLFLGLGPKLVGYSGIPSQKEISPALKDQFAQVPKLSSQDMNLENMLDARADFVFGGWSYGFRPAGVTPELLAKHGVASYVLSESCIHVQKRERVALADTLADLRNVARIFDIEPQAQQQIAKLQASIDQLAAQMQGNTEKPRVFVFDSGEKIPTTVGGFGMPQAMLDAAGGSNIFGDIPTNWPKGNWEDVITRDPEWIIIIDYGRPSAQGKIDFLRAKPELAGVSAIRDQRFFVMSYAEATPGPRNVNVAQRLAAALHADRGITVDPVPWLPAVESKQ